MSWSGGVDSTALVIWYFSNKIPFETVYVKIPNNKINQKKELNARKKILKKLTNLYGKYHIKDNVINFIGVIPNSRHVIVQPYIWAVSIGYCLDLSKYEKISFGYIKGDDFWHCRTQFEGIINLSQSFFKETKIKFEYRFEWNSKESIIQDYYYFDDDVEKVLEMTVFCENISENKILECSCKKCNEYKGAILLADVLK